MLNPTRRIATALCLMSASLWAQTRTQTAYVSPNPVESGKPATVAVSGMTMLCHPSFSHAKAIEENGKLHLSVMAVGDPAAKCTAGEHAYATDFDLPALKAGSFEVNVYLQPECMYALPGCLMAIAPEYGGVLTVNDSAGLAYTFRPKYTQPAKAFALNLIGKNFTCADQFSNLSSNVSGHILYVQFTDQKTPGVVCPAIVKDYGPTFQIPAMQSGVYQVFVSNMPYCGTVGPCPVAMMIPQLAGALTISDGPSAVRAQGKSALRNSGSGDGIRIDSRHGVTGRWKSASNSLTGRRK